jgi:hemerythrin
MIMASPQTKENIMIWSDEMALGVEFQDMDHQEFIALVTAASAADDSTLPAAMAALVSHTREHFAREETMMAECGFFAAHCHKDEHDRVLAELDEIAHALSEGDLTEAKDWLAYSAQSWFENHLATMDTVTARFYLNSKET